MTSKPPVGFQLFICFVNYYELHCIHSGHIRRHVAVLIRKVSVVNARPVVQLSLTLG